MPPVGTARHRDRWQRSESPGGRGESGGPTERARSAQGRAAISSPACRRVWFPALSTRRVLSDHPCARLQGISFEYPAPTCAPCVRSGACAESRIPPTVPKRVSAGEKIVETQMAADGHDAARDHGGANRQAPFRSVPATLRLLAMTSALRAPPRRYRANIPEDRTYSTGTAELGVDLHPHRPARRRHAEHRDEGHPVGAGSPVIRGSGLASGLSGSRPHALKDSRGRAPWLRPPFGLQPLGTRERPCRRHQPLAGHRVPRHRPPAGRGGHGGATSPTVLEDAPTEDVTGSPKRVKPPQASGPRSRGRQAPAHDARGSTNRTAPARMPPRPTVGPRCQTKTPTCR